MTSEYLLRDVLAEGDGHWLLVAGAANKAGRGAWCEASRALEAEGIEAAWCLCNGDRCLHHGRTRRKVVKGVASGGGDDDVESRVGGCRADDGARMLDDDSKGTMKLSRRRWIGEWWRPGLALRG